MLWMVSMSWDRSFSRSNATSLYGREPEPHVERVEELEPDPLLLVQRPYEVGFDLVEPAGPPRLG